MPAATIEEMEKEIEMYEKKRLTPEKIGRIKERIKTAEMYKLKKDSRGRPAEVTYKGKTAFLGDGTHLGETSDVASTTEKCIVANDYLRQGKAEESYALLGNALDQFNKYLSTGYAKEKEAKEAKGIYEAIKKRALKGAKTIAKKDLELAKSFLKIAKEAETYANIRKRLESEEK